ncbi:glycosyltransferase [Pseudofulvibacter geojedonensis]|uniref:Glycosyltransferase n=1 Tax=Pseudofulvibacter geojedonensis TaxID=1123758 RepID=A0ABW3HZQ5_9FLAO
MKVLVIQQKMIGDVLTSTILCERIKKRLPNSEVHFLINTNTVPVVENNPYIDKIVYFKPAYRSSKLALLKFLFSIRKEKYNVVIDAYCKLESNLISLFSGAKTKISYSKYYSKSIYTHPINQAKKPRYNLGLAIEHRLQLIEALGLSSNYKTYPKLYVSEKENKEALNLLVSDGIDTTKKTIMVSIIGSSENKTYPLNYMAKIVDYIAEIGDCNLLFNYIPNQIEQAKEIYSFCKKSTQEKIYFNTLGKSLRSFIALMNQCDYIVGNDGGAINMAKALNKPSYIIFSPWIEKKIWATFEDGIYHKSIHLKDVKPDLFINKSEAYLKKNSINLYQYFKPEYIKDDLQQYLKKINTLNLDNYSLSQSVTQFKHTPISALVITYNEEKNIDDLIENLSFTDEIIIVDSFSTDKTIEKIKSHDNVKLITNKFQNFSNQRNFALEHASHDWVLFIDADERVTPNLKQEIIETVNSSSKEIIAYEMYRKFFFKRELIRFSGWQTDKVFRLYKKQAVTYKKDLLVHELLDIKGSTGIFKHKLLHYSFDSYEEYKSKMTQYAKLRAKELYIKKLRPNAYHFYFKPFYRFVNHFIIRLGFLDGKKGAIVSYLSAYYVKQRYVELKKMYRNEK